MPIERSDLENKLREIEAIVEDTRTEAKSSMTTIAIGVVVFVFLAFLIGRRRGKKSGGARVEVYRLK